MQIKHYLGLILLFGLFNSNIGLAMEEDEPTPTITLQTITLQSNDDQRFAIPINAATRSQLLAGLIEDIPQRLDTPIPIPHDAETLQLIVAGLKKQPYFEKYLQFITNQEIVNLISVVEYFDAPFLLQLIQGQLMANIERENRGKRLSSYELYRNENIQRTLTEAGIHNLPAHIISDLQRAAMEGSRLLTWLRGPDFTHPHRINRYLEIHTTTVKPTKTGLDLKKEWVATYPGADIERLRLIFSGKEISDDKELTQQFFGGEGPVWVVSRGATTPPLAGQLASDRDIARATYNQDRNFIQGETVIYRDATGNLRYARVAPQTGIETGLEDYFTMLYVRPGEARSVMTTDIIGKV